MQKLIGIILLSFLSLHLTGFQFKELRCVKLKEDKKSIFHSGGHFCVTGDELFFVIDQKAGDIKIFDKDGNLLRAWGRRGQGPNEFLNPTCIDYHEKDRLLVVDQGKRRIFLFKRKGRTELVVEKEFRIHSGGYDIAFSHDQQAFLFSGYIIADNQEKFVVCSKNLGNGKSTYLLPIERGYGFDSYRDFEKAYMNTTDIIAIGIRVYCDGNRQNIYSVWEGNLNVTALDRHTGKISSFSHGGSYYRRAIPSKKLRKAYNERNVKHIVSEMKKLCYVSGIFATDHFVGVVYITGEIEGKAPRGTRVQFFSPRGKYIEDIEVKGLDGPTDKFFLVKRDNIIYFKTFNHGTDEADEYFEIKKYRVTGINQ